MPKSNNKGEFFMNKNFIITAGLALIMLIAAPVQASCPINQESASTTQSCNLLYKDKCVLYNALNLTCEQAKCKEELEQKKTQEMSQVLPAYYKAKECLKTLETSKAPKREIKKQTRVVKKLEKKIDKIEECYEKEFKKHLTSLQKSKYHEIERLQKREIEKCNKCECRKLPEGMRPFAPGYGTVQNCQCGKKNCNCNK